MLKPSQTPQPEVPGPVTQALPSFERIVVETLARRARLAVVAYIVLLGGVLASTSLRERFPRASLGFMAGAMLIALARWASIKLLDSPRVSLGAWLGVFRAATLVAGT